jgi:hypothetical protein
MLQKDVAEQIGVDKTSIFNASKAVRDSRFRFRELDLTPGRMTTHAPPSNAASLRPRTARLRPR